MAVIKKKRGRESETKGRVDARKWYERELSILPPRKGSVLGEMRRGKGCCCACSAEQGKVKSKGLSTAR